MGGLDCWLSLLKVSWEGGFSGGIVGYAHRPIILPEYSSQKARKWKQLMSNRIMKVCLKQATQFCSSHRVVALLPTYLSEDNENMVVMKECLNQKHDSP